MKLKEEEYRDSGLYIGQNTLSEAVKVEIAIQIPCSITFLRRSLPASLTSRFPVSLNRAEFSPSELVAFTCALLKASGCVQATNRRFATCISS
jgi:hypothetical protein